MLIATLETCTDTSTIGLLRDDVIIAEIAFPSRHTLVQKALPRLEWLLSESGLQKNDIEAIAVSIGPGSFTGVRIGPAAAKTIASQMQIPLLGISTLAAIAYPFREIRNMLLVPVINARRQQLYTAFFQGTGEGCQRLTADMALSAEDFATEVARHSAQQTVMLLGQLNTIPLAFRENLPAGTCAVNTLVTPSALAALAYEKLQTGEADDPLTLSPIYLRNVAE